MPPSGGSPDTVESRPGHLERAHPGRNSPLPAQVILVIPESPYSYTTGLVDTTSPRRISITSACSSWWKTRLCVVIFGFTQHEAKLLLYLGRQPANGRIVRHSGKELFELSLPTLLLGAHLAMDAAQPSEFIVGGHAEVESILVADYRVEFLSERIHVGPHSAEREPDA